MSTEPSEKINSSLLPNRNASDINFPLLNLWIKTCEEGHKESCGPDSLTIASKKGIGSTPFKIILVDVGQYCLIESTTDERYLALSYVWGGVPQLVLSKQNWDQLSKSHALLQSQWSDLIPPVIRDAIQVTAKF